MIHQKRVKHNATSQNSLIEDKPLTKKGMCSTLRFALTPLGTLGVYEVTARTPKRLVGRLVVNSDKYAGHKVMNIQVDDDHQRCGIATRLYEIAARAACKAGDNLASDTIRSDAAQAFWTKQVKKGRAKCGRKTQPFYDKGKGGCAYFILTKCPVRSLAGAEG